MAGLSTGKVMDQPPPVSPAPAPSSQSKGRLRWLRVLALLVVLAGVAAFFFADRIRREGIEGRVGEILQDVRKQERQESGAFSRVMDFLPDPLAEAIFGSQSTGYTGSYQFAERLAGLGTNAIPLLIRALETDSSADVREVAVMALGELGASAAVPALINALAKDKDAEARSAAADALATIGDPAAVPALKVALRSDSEESVRASIPTALAGMLGAEALPELLAAARKEQGQYVRSRLTWVFGDLGDARALEVLIGWLKEDGPEVAITTANNNQRLVHSGSSEGPDIIRALGQIGGPVAYEALAERWTADKSEQVRKALCEALGAMGDARAAPLLLEVLHDDATLRASAAAALGDLGETNAAPALLSLLQDADKDVRAKAARSLGQIRHAAALPALQRLLADDAAEEVRLDACRALGMIGDPGSEEAILGALSRLGGNQADAVWSLAYLGSTNSIPALATLLNHRERDVRFAAAYALARIGGADAAVTLAAHLTDADEFAGHGKACALLMLGNTNGLDTVRAGLRAKEEWRRFGSALALARRGQGLAGELEPLLQDRAPALRKFATTVREENLTTALTGMLRDPSRDFRQYAARGLIFVSDPAALPALRAACKDADAQVRDAARVAVGCQERLAPVTR